MLIDHRTYLIKPGHTRAHLDIYEKYGYKAQTRHLGEPVLYMFAESGAMNQDVPRRRRSPPEPRNFRPGSVPGISSSSR